MKSFSPREISKDYFIILFKKDDILLRSRFFFHLIIPSLLALLVSFSIDKINENLISSLGILVSVLAGLLFNFVSSLASHIPSDHLNQQSKDKVVRLNLIKETYTATFVSIFICVVLIFLSFILNIEIGSSETNFWNFIKFFFQRITFVLVIILVYHLILFLILMLNRLKKLMDIDVKEEIKRHENDRKADIDKWDKRR